MIKKILVATDFSSESRNAAKYAIDMALAIKADILLFHAYQLPVSFSEVPVLLSYDELIQGAERNVARLKKDLIQETSRDINIETQVCVGAFFTELVTVCDRVHPYAVVMGCQGTTGAKRMFFGSHAVYAMKHLQWPVITVPKNASFLRISKIGLSCNFENLRETIPVDEIRILVKDFNAELHVINAAPSDKFIPGSVSGAALLEDLLDGIKLEYHFVAGNSDEYIMEFAEVNHIDLLIVFPKRHGLIDKLIHKSHTKQLVLHSHVPVMALHHDHEHEKKETKVTS